MSSATNTIHDQFNHQAQLPPCDLVLKGGVASGVIYPPAIQQISEVFRLKGVGGASAGAIGAVGAAAAELGRQRKLRGQITRGGFDLIDDLNQEIIDQNLIADFFQPQPATRSIFRTAVRIVDARPALEGASLFRKAASIYTSVALNYPVQAVAGAMGGALYASVIPALALAASKPQTGKSRAGLATAALAMAVPAAVVGAAAVALPWFAVDALRNIPKNNYGMCSGLSSSEQPVSLTAKLGRWFSKRFSPATEAIRPPEKRPVKGPALSEWLASYVDRLAGQDEIADRPVTYRDIWEALGGPSPVAPSKRRDIDLQVITTCLSQGRPYLFPFADTEIFYFRTDQFNQLFPRDIVDWLVARSPTPDGDVENPDYYQLPAAEDLPIMMAARISLSFPILLSAIPLWSKNESGFKQCWFSDGGISSNFPIHFFDSPIPRWPTLAINLGGEPPAPDPRVIPVPGSDNLVWSQLPGYNPHREIDGVIDFLLKVLSTARNWTDSFQARLPGYSDRIIHVGTGPGEGGLNLNMPPEVSAKLLERGQKAGSYIRDRFKPEPGGLSSEGWQNHRWLRYSSSMAVIDDFIQAYNRGYSNPDISPTNRELIESRCPLPGNWCDPEQLQRIITITENFSGLNHVWSVPNRIFDIEELSSAAILRVRPRI